MTIENYIKKYYTKKANHENKQQKAAEYLKSRIHDLEIDFGKNSREVDDYLKTELSLKSIANMEKLCTQYYGTMLSSDCDYMIQDCYSYEELLELVQTK